MWKALGAELNIMYLSLCDLGPFLYLHISSFICKAKRFYYNLQSPSHYRNQKAICDFSQRNLSLPLWFLSAFPEITGIRHLSGARDSQADSVQSGFSPKYKIKINCQPWSQLGKTSPWPRISSIQDSFPLTDSSRCLSLLAVSFIPARRLCLRTF